MLTIFRTTAGTGILLCCLAVFFATGASAADSSLIRLEDRINELIYKASRSVVTIEAIRTGASNSSSVPGHEPMHTLVASGIIYDSLGHILVAASSVKDRDQIRVRFDNRVLLASLQGVDERTGLALLSVGRSIGEPAHVVPRSGCAGQMVVAVGNAYGVRAAPSIGFCAGVRFDGIMQFSAVITSGTVGGGVFDLSGNLVGVISGGIGRDRFAEVGLAVPAAKISGVVSYITQNGDRHAGWIGVRVADIEISPAIEMTHPTSLVAAGSGQGRLIEHGVLVTNVVPGSPAARAGLQMGDLLFLLDGSTLQSALQLQNHVRNQPPGSPVELGFLRRETPYVVQFKIGRRTNQAETNEPFDSITPERDSTPRSLEREIDSLKQVLYDLEQRLRRLQ